MSARRVDNGIITVIAIDKDKNSQHALKWAVENILVDSPQCVLLHVEPKGIISIFIYLSSSKQKMSDNSNEVIHLAEGNTGAHIQRDNQDDSHQFFLPFRGFCSRKGVSDHLSISFTASKHLCFHYLLYQTAFSDYSQGGSS